MRVNDATQALVFLVALFLAALLLVARLLVALFLAELFLASLLLDALLLVALLLVALLLDSLLFALERLVIYIFAKYLSIDVSIHREWLFLQEIEEHPSPTILDISLLIAVLPTISPIQTTVFAFQRFLSDEH